MAPGADGHPGITSDELRVVTRFVLGSAAAVLDVFEAVHPDDDRPREAVDAARAFVDGAARSRRQRVASLDAHRAARDAVSEAARHAAHAAGTAASAPYLHPPAQVLTWSSTIARETQVGHVLRAAAHAAHVAELLADGDGSVADAHLAQTFRRAPREIADVVRRYPPLAAGRNRVSRLAAELDRLFRDS